MNSHVVLKLGVAYKASLKHIVQVIVFSVVFSGIISVTDSAPFQSMPNFNSFSFDRTQNNSDILLPGLKPPATPTYSFLSANNNMYLEILENGAVRASPCRTKFGALSIGSHSTTTKVHMESSRNVQITDNKTGSFLRGVVSERYLCVNETGHVYGSKEPNEIDCRFIQKPKIEKEGYRVHFYKHLRHKYEGKNKKRRFQLGFNDSGDVFVVRSRKDMRNSNRNHLRISWSKLKIDDINNFKDENCRHKPKKPKRRYKFCRRVWKSFFKASIKDLRRFRKYNCWDKLKKRTQQTNKHDTG